MSHDEILVDAEEKAVAEKPAYLAAVIQALSSHYELSKPLPEWLYRRIHAELIDVYRKPKNQKRSKHIFEKRIVHVERWFAATALYDEKKDTEDKLTWVQVFEEVGAELGISARTVKESWNAVQTAYRDGRGHEFLLRDITFGPTSKGD